MPFVFLVTDVCKKLYKHVRQSIHKYTVIAGVTMFLLATWSVTPNSMALVIDDAGADDSSAASAVDLREGAKLYKRMCKGCHGADGRGGAHTFMPHVSKLTEKGYIEQLPDGYLMLVISKGGLAVGKSSYMPAWESTLSTSQINNIIAHIRNLPRY